MTDVLPPPAPADGKSPHDSVEDPPCDYQEWVLPAFFRALRQFGDRHEYSWHTPAHAGGVAFLKSPVGRAYFDYYGERLFRTDLSISVAELGSPLEHTGPGHPCPHAGEATGAAGAPLLTYLSALEAYDRRFPPLRDRCPRRAPRRNRGYWVECIRA